MSIHQPSSWSHPDEEPTPTGRSESQAEPPHVARPPAGAPPPPADATLPAATSPPPAASQPAQPGVHVRIEPGELQRATIRILLVISAWLVAIWVVGAARHFLFLILLAWLMAIAGEPAIHALVRRGRRRGVATAIVGGTALVVVVGLFVVFGTAVFEQASQLLSQGPTFIDRVVAQVNEAFGLNLDPTAIAASLQLGSADVQGLATALGGGLLGVFGSLASVLFDLITVVVFAFYIAGAGPGLVLHLAVWMPPERQRMLDELWEIATEKTGGYVASKVVLSAVSSLFYGTFFYFIGLPGWLPLALLVGITAQFVPLIGTYIGIAVPIVVALGDKPINALWIALFALVYQQIETYVFTPRISQRTMDVNPAIALAAVFLGAAIWGPIGAIIGVPIAAVVVSVVWSYGKRHELAVELRDSALPGDSDVPGDGPDPRLPGDSRTPSFPENGGVSAGSGPQADPLAPPAPERHRGGLARRLRSRK